jgi:pyruvate dehydrogenase E1 component alpha subunit
MSARQETVAMSTKVQHHQKLPEGLTPSELKTIYEHMVLIREYDDRGFKLQRQGRIGFFAGSFGEEACQIGTAFAVEERDWIFSSYRQAGVALFRGVPMQEMYNNLFGNAEDIIEGKQMPVHYSSKKHHFLSISSVIGTQVIQGVGCAMAAKIKKEDTVVLTYFGDGGTSSNDFHSGMNFAATFKAPCIFVLVNNQYAISTAVQNQTACEVLADKAKAYGMPGIQVDGNDVLAVYKATKEATERARRGEGPTLLELKTYRAGPHSSSDDPTRYRSKEETEAWLKRDPLLLFRKQLQEFGLWDEAYEQEVRESIQNRISEAIKVAESLPQPEWGTLSTEVYSYTSQVLADQIEDILTNESGLELTNEGEFPL